LLSLSLFGSSFCIRLYRLQMLTARASGATVGWHVESEIAHVRVVGRADDATMVVQVTKTPRDSAISQQRYLRF